MAAADSETSLGASCGSSETSGAAASNGRLATYITGFGVRNPISCKNIQGDIEGKAGGGADGRGERETAGVRRFYWYVKNNSRCPALEWYDSNTLSSCVGGWQDLATVLSTVSLS